MQGVRAEVTNEKAAEVEIMTGLAAQERLRGKNFFVPETGLKPSKGETIRFKANVEAIKILTPGWQGTTAQRRRRRRSCPRRAST